MVKLIIYLTVDKLTSKKISIIEQTADMIALIIYSNVTLQVFIIP